MWQITKGLGGIFKACRSLVNVLAVSGITVSSREVYFKVYFKVCTTAFKSKNVILNQLNYKPAEQIMKALMDEYEYGWYNGTGSLLLKCSSPLVFQTGCFQIQKRSRSADLYKIRIQPWQILQDFPFLVDAACTPESSDESRCSGFMQLQAVRPDGLITQVKARGD